MTPVTYSQGSDCVRVSPDAPLQVRLRSEACFRAETRAFCPLNPFSPLSVCRRPERGEGRIRRLGKPGTYLRAERMGPDPALPIHLCSLLILGTLRTPRLNRPEGKRLMFGGVGAQMDHRPLRS